MQEAFWRRSVKGVWIVAEVKENHVKVSGVKMTRQSRRIVVRYLAVKDQRPPQQVSHLPRYQHFLCFRGAKVHALGIPLTVGAQSCLNGFQRQVAFALIFP